VLGLLEQALRDLPDEIREARWALRDRDELMAAEMQKAQQLMDQVRAEAARMVDKTEIVRQSRLVAQQIIAEAHTEARQLINQSEDFIDGKLGSFEIVLERLLKTTRSGRERLNAQGLPTSLIEEPPDEDTLMPTPASAYGEVRLPEETSFFDQDAY
jgi:cell division septum initiation protein DivIVA